MRKIGIALGSGSARGFAHVGILKALHELGIEPDIIAGTSIGSIVGAFYAKGCLGEFDNWAKTLNRKSAFKLMDINLIPKGGFVEGDRLLDFFKNSLGTTKIEELSKPYAAVATDLLRGQEIWLREGELLSAIKASMALPGILPPFHHDGRWLVDGGLVNPVPVSTCRALGADMVIAVDLNNQIVGRHLKNSETPSKKEQEETWLQKVKANLFESEDNEPQRPRLFDVMAGSINIMQDRITRSRMSGDPPEVLLTPRLSHMGLLDFDSVQDAMEEGYSCVRRNQEWILEQLE